MDELVPVAISLCASFFIGIGVFCLAAIVHPINVAAMAGIGSFCVAMAATFLIWALARAGF